MTSHCNNASVSAGTGCHTTPPTPASTPTAGVPCVAFGGEGWEAATWRALRSHGVVVVRDVLEAGEAADTMDELVGSLHTMCPELRSARKDAWDPALLPPGPRAGMCQHLAGQLPVVWRLRTHARVRRVFAAAYSGLRGHAVRDFVTSCDGLTVRPPVAPFHTPDAPDWAHLDQTSGDAYECVQGQVVLNESTACFRASPRSHLCFERIIGDGCRHATGNRDFFLLRKHDTATARALVEAEGGAWQVPVRAPAGAMVLWLSSVVHSAQVQTAPVRMSRKAKRAAAAEGKKAGKWQDWRGVVYICLRPREDVGEEHVARLQRCYYENLTTNHWGRTIFRIKARDENKLARPASIRALVDNPRAVFQLAGLHQPLTDDVAALLGMESA